MAVTFTFDPIEPFNIRETITGTEVERFATVYGLSPSTYPTRVEQCNAAKGAVGLILGNALGLGVPNCFLEEISYTNPSETLDQIRIKYVYRQRFSEQTIEVGTTVQQEQTCYDKDQKLMLVTYTKEGSTVEEKQNVVVSKFLPQSKLVVTRMEVGSPGDKSRNYAGYVNSGGWSLDPSAPAHTWVCLGINGRSADRINFQVTYEFLYKADKWDVLGFYVAKTGRIPGDIPEGTAPDVVVNGSKPIRAFKIYGERNFGSLSL